MKLGIIDYGAGNLQSVFNSFAACHIQGRLVRSPQDAAELTHLVLPGVGMFGDCVRQLQTQRLVPLIQDWIAQNKPFLGICVGYQVLFESGEEGGTKTAPTPGLGILPGKVVRFNHAGLKVPHMGWNNLLLHHPDNPVWQGLGESPYFYFVHSYYPQPADPAIVAATCTYGTPFAAAIQRGNLVVTQFHPEKSQKLGLRLLANFAALS